MSLASSEQILSVITTALEALGALCVACVALSKILPWGSPLQRLTWYLGFQLGPAIVSLRGQHPAIPTPRETDGKPPTPPSVVTGALFLGLLVFGLLASGCAMSLEEARLVGVHERAAAGAVSGPAPTTAELAEQRRRCQRLSDWDFACKVAAGGLGAISAGGAYSLASLDAPSADAKLALGIGASTAGALAAAAALCAALESARWSSECAQ